MDFECLLNSMFWFDLLDKLTMFELTQVEMVCHLFRCGANQDSVWRAVSVAMFRGKCFVPCICHRFLTPGNSKEERKDLEKMNVKALKQLCVSYRLDASECFEKSEIISLINQRELKNSMENECLAKYAVRIAWIDRVRNTITPEELCSLEWNVRIRGDGPLAWLASPWWQDQPAGKAFFKRDGQLNFSFPEPHNPFRDFGVPTMYYELEYFGSVVRLNVGVQEVITRHPVNWGWIMMSGGTLWTGFVLPPRNEDPLLEDNNIEELLYKEPNFGFRWY